MLLRAEKDEPYEKQEQSIRFRAFRVFRGNKSVP